MKKSQKVPLEIYNLLDRCPQILNEEKLKLRNQLKDGNPELENMLRENLKNTDMAKLQQELRKYLKRKSKTEGGNAINRDIVIDKKYTTQTFVPPQYDIYNEYLKQRNIYNNQLEGNTQFNQLQQQTNKIAEDPQIATPKIQISGAELTQHNNNLFNAIPNSANNNNNEFSFLQKYDKQDQFNVKNDFPFNINAYQKTQNQEQQQFQQQPFKQNQYQKYTVKTEASEGSTLPTQTYDKNEILEQLRQKAIKLFIDENSNQSSAQIQIDQQKQISYQNNYPLQQQNYQIINTSPSFNPPSTYDTTTSGGNNTYFVSPQIQKNIIQLNNNQYYQTQPQQSVSPQVNTYEVQYQTPHYQVIQQKVDQTQIQIQPKLINNKEYPHQFRNSKNLTPQPAKTQEKRLYKLEVNTNNKIIPQVNQQQKVDNNINKQAVNIRQNRNNYVIQVNEPSNNKLPEQSISDTINYKIQEPNAIADMQQNINKLNAEQQTQPYKINNNEQLIIQKSYSSNQVQTPSENSYQNKFGFPKLNNDTQQPNQEQSKKYYFGEGPIVNTIQQSDLKVNQIDQQNKANIKQETGIGIKIDSKELDIKQLNNIALQDEKIKRCQNQNQEDQKPIWKQTESQINRQYLDEIILKNKIPPPPQDYQFINNNKYLDDILRCSPNIKANETINKQPNQPLITNQDQGNFDKQLNNVANYNNNKPQLEQRQTGDQFQVNLQKSPIENRKRSNNEIKKNEMLFDNYFEEQQKQKNQHSDKPNITDAKNNQLSNMVNKNKGLPLQINTDLNQDQATSNFKNDQFKNNNFYTPQYCNATNMNYFQNANIQNNNITIQQNEQFPLTPTLKSNYNQDSNFALNQINKNVPVVEGIHKFEQNPPVVEVINKFEKNPPFSNPTNQFEKNQVDDTFLIKLDKNNPVLNPKNKLEKNSQETLPLNKFDNHSPTYYPTNKIDNIPTIDNNITPYENYYLNNYQDYKMKVVPQNIVQDDQQNKQTQNYYKNNYLPVTHMDDAKQATPEANQNPGTFNKPQAAILPEILQAEERINNFLSRQNKRDMRSISADIALQNANSKENQQDQGIRYLPAQPKDDSSLDKNHVQKDPKVNEEMLMTFNQAKNNNKSDNKELWLDQNMDRNSIPFLNKQTSINSYNDRGTLLTNPFGSSTDIKNVSQDSNTDFGVTSGGSKLRFKQAVSINEKMQSINQKDPKQEANDLNYFKYVSSIDEMPDQEDQQYQSKLITKNNKELDWQKGYNNEVKYIESINVQQAADDKKFDKLNQFENLNKNTRGIGISFSPSPAVLIQQNIKQQIPQISRFLSGYTPEEVIQALYNDYGFSIRHLTKEYFVFKMKTFTKIENDKELEVLFEFCDANKDKYVEVHECGVAMETICGREEVLTPLKNMFSTGKDFTITKEELTNFFQTRCNQNVPDLQMQIGSFFAGFDFDNKGKVSYWDVYINLNNVIVKKLLNLIPSNFKMNLNNYK